MRLDLNVASRPMIPSSARAAAAVAVAASAAILVGMSWGWIRASGALARERDSLPAVAVAPTPIVTPPEIAALAAVVGPRPPAWTSVFSSLERSLPAGARLDHVEWRGGDLVIRVIARDESMLRGIEEALSRVGSAEPLSQGFQESGVLAVYRVGVDGA